MYRSTPRSAIFPRVSLSEFAPGLTAITGDARLIGVADVPAIAAVLWVHVRIHALAVALLEPAGTAAATSASVRRAGASALLAHLLVLTIRIR